MLSDFNSLERNIEILTELTGINIEVKDIKNISCLNPVCNNLFDIETGKGNLGCVFLCKCGNLYFCTLNDKKALVFSPVDINCLTNPLKQDLIFKRLNAYYLLNYIISSTHTEYFKLSNTLKDCVTCSDKDRFGAETEAFLLKLIDDFGSDIFSIKSRITEITLELLNNENKIDKGKIVKIIKTLWDAESISELFDTTRKLKDLFFAKSSHFPRQSKADTISLALEYMERNYDKNITLDDLSKKVFVSKAYLSRIFTEITDNSFLYSLNKIRVEKSKYYLKHTDMSISAIALKVGYSNSEYYSKMFKKITHLSPTEYRISQERMLQNVDLQRLERL